MEPLSPLESMLAGERSPADVLGPRFGYNGPPKPSDLSTAAYIVMFLVSASLVIWTTIYGVW